MLRLASILAALAGCLRSNDVICADGVICPDNTTCVRVGDPLMQVCAEPEQLEQCEGRRRFARCGERGRCYDGVCLPVACGNERIDRVDPDDPADTDGEICDDGNERSGDGCASDCRSNETCGNGVVDLVKGEGCDDGDVISNDGCASACQPEQLRWQERGIDPLTFTGVAVAVDPWRDRVVMFGGLEDVEGFELLDETWEWNGRSWLRVDPPQSPPPRELAGMAYHATQRRTVLFGGRGNAGDLDDTWLWDGAAWEQPATTESPGSRTGHKMVYDSRRDRVVLFGGFGGFPTEPRSDTWEWDGSTWRRIASATSAPTRYRFAMAYDPRRGVTVMFGGGPDLTGAVYEYDGVDWVRVDSERVPATRVGASMVFDPSSGRVVLVGGRDPRDGTILSDSWGWDGERWHEMGSPSPALLDSSVAVTDHRRARLSLFGQTSLEGARVGSHWSYDGSGWSWHRFESATLKEPRAAFDPDRGRVVGQIVGVTDATFEFDGAAWHELAAPGPLVDLPELAYDPVRKQTVLFGSETVAGEVMGSTWTWNGASWTEHTLATRPPPRTDHGMAFDHHRGRVVMFGAANCAETCEYLDDLWEWTGAAWALVGAAHRPSARGDFGFAADPVSRTILLFGGVGADEVLLGDTWSWNGTDWIELHPANRPSPRRGSAIAWDASRGRLVLVGGRSDEIEPLNDIWEWDGADWVRLLTVNTPRRFDHVLTPAIGGGVMLFGGLTAGNERMGTSHLLRWEGLARMEACRSIVDDDRDGFAGCADADCGWACSPLCPPETSCAAGTPRCGDGTCNAALEDCWICPADCTCAPSCGDTRCEAGETSALCPGDCP